MYRFGASQVNAMVFSMVLLLAGCGGGSSSGTPDPQIPTLPNQDTPVVDNPQQDQPNMGADDGSSLPTVSKTLLMPLEILTISVPSAVTGTMHSVRFTSNSGFDVIYDVQAEEDGEVFLSTPYPIANSDSSIDMSVYVDGQLASSSITVEALPEVEGEPGALTLIFLERIATTYDDVSFYLEELPFTNAGFQTTDLIVQASIRAYDRVDEIAEIFEAIESGAGSVELFPGTQIQLDDEFITLMDRWILAMAIAVESELVANAGTVTSNATTGVVTPRAKLNKAEADRQVRAMMDAVRGIGDLPTTTVRKGKEAASLYFKVFGAFFGAISLAPEVVISENVAKLAGVSGVALTHLNVLLDFAIGTVSSAMSKGAREGNRVKFEAGKLLGEKLDELLLSYCGGTTGKLGKVCTAGAILKDQLDVADDVETSECGRSNNVFARAIGQFCEVGTPEPDQPATPPTNPEPTPEPETQQLLVNCCSGPSTVEFDTGSEWDFSITGGQTPYTYRIDWGDGAISSSGSNGVEPIGGIFHTYRSLGNQTINITVTDAEGNRAKGTLAITVKQPEPEPEPEPEPPTGTSQILPTADLCPAQLGSRDGSALSLFEFNRSSNNSHHCVYKWNNSGTLSVPVIIFYTTEMHTTSRPRTEVFCTGANGADDSVLVGDLSNNSFVRTRVGSNSRQVQVEGQTQFFNVQELTAILRAAVSKGIGNSC